MPRTPVASERHTLLKRPGGLWAVTGSAIARAHAEREAITAHTETQEPLRELVMAVLALSRGGAGGACFLG